MAKSQPKNPICRIPLVSCLSNTPAAIKLNWIVFRLVPNSHCHIQPWSLMAVGKTPWLQTSATARSKTRKKL